MISYNSWIAVGAVTVILLFESSKRLTVDYIVHRGGFIAGIACGWILRQFKRPNPLPPDEKPSQTKKVNE
jgi:membrane associated rhomboid family serine protease